ncbi:MAG: hypothetical protein AAGF27_00930 [Pseudomonadota bacterium]
MIKRRIGLLFGLVMLAVGACAPVPDQIEPTEIAALSRGIRALDPTVDPREAERAAYLAYTYSLQLREDYRITTSPILHNVKVNNGLRERGICVHWAEDIEARLNEEDFQTLQIHRAIAEGSEVRIDHSTAIISARGEGMNEGIVLDPWRRGGYLYWSPTLEDTRYFWEPRQLVLERKYRRNLGIE